MRIIGKIDRQLYQCVTNDIVTDEVIITDNQIQHVKDRHSGAFETSADILKEAIETPDYIIEDRHKNTGLVIKKLPVKGRSIQIVLRLCSSEDDCKYKNSIISCWEISEKRLENYLRNKRILYKKEEAIYHK